MDTINVKPGAFGKAILTTYNPIMDRFCELLTAAGIDWRYPTPEEQRAVFCEWRTHTLKDFIKRTGSRRSMEVKTEITDWTDLGLDRTMEVQELRFQENTIFVWCGALVLERDSIIDAASAEAERIIKIWQEV